MTKARVKSKLTNTITNNTTVAILFCSLKKYLFYSPVNDLIKSLTLDIAAQNTC